MSKKNTKVTEKQKKQAIAAVKKAQDAFKISGQVDPNDIKLASEYITHAGQLVRKSKSAETRAKNKAKSILSHEARLIDAVRIILPAINNLQREYISAEQGNRIIVDTLKHHGYKNEDFYAGAKRQSKRSAQHYDDVIKNFEKRYAKEHSKGSKAKKAKKASK